MLNNNLWDSTTQLVFYQRLIVDALAKDQKSKWSRSEDSLIEQLRPELIEEFRGLGFSHHVWESAITLLTRAGNIERFYQQDQYYLGLPEDV